MYPVLHLLELNTQKERNPQTSQTEPSQPAERKAGILSKAKNQNLSSLRILWPTTQSSKTPAAGTAVKMITDKI